MFTSKKLWGLVLAFAMLLTPFEALAQAPQDEPLPVENAGAETELNPETFDMEMYAKEQGIDLAEAERRFAVQDIAGELEAKLVEGESETFAGLWLEHTPEFRVVVQFTQDNKDISAYLDSPELAGVVDVRTAKVSLNALEADQRSAMMAAEKAGIPVESEINVQANTVDLYVAERARLDGALAAGELQLPSTVQVTTVESMGNSEATIYGGLPLSTCTSGFTVRNSAGTRGVSTAAHCGNSQSYAGIALTYRGQVFRDYYDVQWHSASGHTFTNLIRWWSSGTTRRITATKSRASQTIGGYVCKYGKTTHYTCGYISSKTYAPSYVPSVNATFIRVNNTAGYANLSSGGDSGGPWFLTSTAYGIHSGSPGADPNDAIYMAINYISGLGVSVLLTP
ncbi:MAG: S1 family peptidase [Chloroflexota bacterium]